LAALAGAVVVLLVGTTGIVAIAGRDPKLAFPLTNTVLYGVSLVVAPAVFIAVGAVTSQLGRTRRVATGLGMAVFAATMVLRMIADSGSATRWMLWLTPFGWIERMRPYTEADWRPVGLAAVAVVVLGFAAIRLASTRDVGAGVIATSEVSELRPFGLRSTTGLVLRGEAGVLIAWIVGVCAGTFAFGIVAKVVSDALPDSSLDTFEKLGLSGTIVGQYFGVAFLLVATIVALLPVGQIAAAAEDEGEGRTALVLALPVQRARMLGGRLVIAAAAVVVAAALAGVAGWLGAATQHVDSGFASMLGAGLNVVPTALVVLGLGAVVLAVAPRAAAPAWPSA